MSANHHLRKHADYQRVYRDSRRQSGRQLAWFCAPRLTTAAPQIENKEINRPLSAEHPRIGLTVPKAIGNAVLRNRIKRRMRAAVSRHIHSLTAPVDVVLHPRRTAAEIEFTVLEREIAAIFTRIQKDFAKQP
jgi:ribonuclease P protein component